MTLRAQPEASHFIDGQFAEDTAGAPIEVVHPADGEVIARLHAATPALIDRALDARPAGAGRLGGAAAGRARAHPAPRRRPHARAQS
jgi:betaine-aldehyde dehydrogenase